MVKLDYIDPLTGEKQNDQSRRRLTIIFITIVLISLLLGAIGGVGGVLLLSENGALAKKLGLENVSIPTTKTEKIVVEESSAIIEASKKVAPAVVSITQTKTVQNLFGQVFEAEGAGTGFVITSDGLILTNRHVASDQNADYTVIMADGTTYPAKIKSVDPTQDIAVLQVEARNLPVVELGDSEQLQVGQWVVAIGNALGKYQNTVTTGVVSGRNRKIEATDSSNGSTETLNNLLQTDAPINQGNSGGPLVNLKGQVIGINTAVAANAQGIGFAIPINEAKTAIESIQKTGRIVRPYIGLRYVQVTPDLAKENNLTVDYGAWVVRGNGMTQVAVLPGSPADKAGIQENDIILEINGEKVTENNALAELIQQYQVGDEVTLKVLSKGEEKTTKVKLEERK